MSSINWDCEFFEGENEILLLGSTLNDVELERLPDFIRMLNEYLQNTPAWEREVTGITLDGCEDALVHSRIHATSMPLDDVEICSETSFQDILDMLQ